MIKVIGQKNCSRCDMVKNILKNKQLEFQYSLLDELEDEDKSKYLKMARQSKQLAMPLIIKDNMIVDLKSL